MNEKVYENRLRRWAKRLGLKVMKSRARRLHLDNFGEYMLVDTSANVIVDGSKFDLSLEDIERILHGIETDLNK